MPADRKTAKSSSSPSSSPSSGPSSGPEEPAGPSGPEDASDGPGDSSDGPEETEAPAPLNRAERRHQLVATLEVDQQHAHHARFGEALRVGPEPTYVAGVAHGNGAYGVLGRSLES